MLKPKAQRGTVTVHSVKGRLRLIGSFCGKRYFFALELPGTKANRAIAEMKAKQVERDIANDLFDSTLKKYRAAFQRRTLGLSAAGVFEKYIPQPDFLIICNIDPPLSLANGVPDCGNVKRVNSERS